MPGTAKPIEGLTLALNLGRELSRLADEGFVPDVIAARVIEQGMAFHHASQWMSLLPGCGGISEGTGNQSVYFRASVSGRRVGVLPIVHLKRVIFGGSLVSLPYFNHCGVLADDRAARDAPRSGRRGPRRGST